MRRALRPTSFATLALIALAFLLVADDAAAAPAAPINDVEYSCSGGDWKTLKLAPDFPRRGTLRRGVVFKNGDNRKAALALKNNIWEFTLENDMQCKELFVMNMRGYSRLFFAECSDNVVRRCTARI